MRRASFRVGAAHRSSGVLSTQFVNVFVSVFVSVFACLYIWGAGAARGETTDQELIAKIESTIVDVDYAPEDFSKIVDQLRAQHGLNVQVSWGVLDVQGVRKDQRVEISLRQVSLSALLDTLVRELDPRGEIGWGVERGIVIISSRGAIGRHAILRAYDVRDLLESGYALRRFANTPTLTLTLTGREQLGGERRHDAATTEKSGGGGGGGGGFGGGGSGGGGAIFGSPGEDPEQLTRMERIEMIADLVTSHVEVETWQDNGGEVGLLHEHNGVLLIQQTLKAHQRIEALLELLRSTTAQPLTLDVAIVRLSPQAAAQLRARAGERFPIVPLEWFSTSVFGSAPEGVLYRGTAASRSGEAFWLSDIVQRSSAQAMLATTAQGVSVVTPELADVHDGLELIVLPLLAAGSDQVQLDVQMAWKPPTEATERKDVPTLPTIDLLHQRMRSVSARLALHSGEVAVVSIPSAPTANTASITSEDWLVVRVARTDGASGGG